MSQNGLFFFFFLMRYERVRRDWPILVLSMTVGSPLADLRGYGSLLIGFSTLLSLQLSGIESQSIQTLYTRLCCSQTV